MLRGSENLTFSMLRGSENRHFRSSERWQNARRRKNTSKTASRAEKGAPHRKNVARGGRGRQEERPRASRSRPRASKLMTIRSLINQKSSQSRLQDGARRKPADRPRKYRNKIKKTHIMLIAFSDMFSGRVARFGGGGGEGAHMDFVATVLKVLQFSLMHPLCGQRQNGEQITKRKTKHCPRTEG